MSLFLGDGNRLTLTRVLLCGAIVLTLSMGIRHGFGLWLQPMTMDRGWTREAFAFAMAGGSAALLAQGTQLAGARDVRRLLPQVTVERVDDRAALRA